MHIYQYHHCLFGDYAAPLNKKLRFKAIYNGDFEQKKRQLVSPSLSYKNDYAER